MTDRDDDRLRALYGAMREADHARTPSVDAVLARPRRIMRPLPVRRLTIAAAGIAAAAALWIVEPSSREAPSISAISSWLPPTDALLPAPSSTALGGIPPLSSSILDSFLPPVTDSSQGILP